MTAGKTTFRGFGGVPLAAETAGDEHDPAVLLIHGPGHTRAIWDRVRSALVQSGRRVVELELRGHGASGRAPTEAYSLQAHVEDLRAVLAQMEARPVVVAAAFAGWIAALALAENPRALASALVLVDMPLREDVGVASELSERLGSDRTQIDAAASAGFAGEGVLDTIMDAVPALKLPTLVVRGGLSWLERSAEAAVLDRSLPEAEFAEIADADLLVVTDRAEAFLAVLLDFLERKQPLRPKEFRAGSDARTLRDAMGCFATGVTIVTAIDSAGRPVGLTANSFTSLSLDPPLLLVCISSRSGSAAVLREAEVFGVNVLQIAQQTVSNRFAGASKDRFADTAWRTGEYGMPLIERSLVSLECRRNAVHEGGDHFILVGEVLRAEFEPRRDPLLYFMGRYRRLHIG